MFARKVLLIALAGLASCGLFSGCSSGSSSTAPAPRTYLNINGSWGFTATSTTYQGAVAPVGVQLTATNGAVTGIAHIISPCFVITDNVPLTGTQDYDGNVTLTSAAVGGKTLTVTGKLASATSLSSGTYAIAASNGCKDAGTITGSVVAPVSGNYSGSVKSSAIGATFPVSATLTQTTTVDSNGLEHLSGSAAFTGSPCFTSTPITTPNTDTNVIGNIYSANFAAGNTSYVATYGTISADAKTIIVNYQVVGGSCAGDYGVGSLTKQ